MQKEATNGAISAMQVRIAYRFGQLQMKIVSQRREQAKWLYNRCRFRSQKGNSGLGFVAMRQGIPASATTDAHATDHPQAPGTQPERRQQDRSWFNSLLPLPMLAYDCETLQILAVNETAIHHYDTREKSSCP